MSDDFQGHPTTLVVGMTMNIDLTTGKTTVQDHEPNFKKLRQEREDRIRIGVTSATPWVVEWFLPVKNRDPGDPEWHLVSEGWMREPVALQQAMLVMQKAKTTAAGAWRCRNLLTGQLVLCE